MVSGHEDKGGDKSPQTSEIYHHGGASRGGRGREVKADTGIVVVAGHGGRGRALFDDTPAPPPASGRRSGRLGGGLPRHGTRRPRVMDLNLAPRRGLGLRP